MSHNALTLQPGVNQNRTPAMNQAGISTCQLIRFIPDTQLGGIPQKLGGWQKFFPNSIGSIVRFLWAWADINDNFYLGVGAEASLSVFNYGQDGMSPPNLFDITPAMATDNPSVSVSTTSGSALVNINDPGSDISNYDSVFVATPISVGGLIIYGLYQCIEVDANNYQIASVNVLGNPAPATATVTNGGSIPAYTTSLGSSIVTVTLANHGYRVGSNYTAYVSNTISGVTIFGDYAVLSVVDANNFTIGGPNTATAGTGPTAINGGNARYIYLIGNGPAVGGTGFGVGGFGTGGFGSGVVPPVNPGTPITTTDWSLDNWGSIFIACPLDGAIYAWNPLGGETRAAAISQAPFKNIGVFVAMPQRQIIAFGSTFDGIIDHLLVRWCDIENYNQWIALPQNQAGSFRLTRGSRIIGAIQGPQQSYLWTDVGLWSMQYIGQPDVYSFNEIGVGCGLIGSKAAGALGGVTYWMGQSQFYALGGDGVQTINCPIWDVIFQDLDTSNLDKIRFAGNSRFGEITWYYPTISSGGEVSNYVKYNSIIQQWDYGALGRTAWINQSIFGPPIGADTNQFIQQHETSPDADGQAMQSGFTTGYFALSEGNWEVFVDQVWPDMKWGFFGGTQNANVNITFYTADYPGQTPVAHGPFTVTEATTFITPRIRARLMAIEISSADIGSFWRLGQLRYRSQQDGKY